MDLVGLRFSRTHHVNEPVRHGTVAHDCVSESFRRKILIVRLYLCKNSEHIIDIALA